jgi:ATPase subunit of ABC transporter with duplicated ATPase domains
MLVPSAAAEHCFGEDRLKGAILRLTKASVNGFGRIAAGSIDLTPRVVAVVGPNEAGKSTLLDALHYLTDTSSTLPSTRRSRTAKPSDDTIVVKGIYVLEEHETQSFGDIDLEELPRKLELSRRAGETTRYMQIEPLPQRSRSKVAVLATQFQQFVTKSSFFDLGPSDDSEIDEDWAERKSQALEGLEGTAETLIDTVTRACVGRCGTPCFWRP